MPLVNSNYQPSKWLLNSHLETIIPGLFRKVSDVNYIRERINTPDDDFLDIDWVKNNSKRLVIISHGLEGNSDRPYMKGMAKIFADNNYDVIAWNFRGCGGEVNRQIRFYHSGVSDDLDIVIQHAINQGYKSINLIGFSLGGNLTLKYLGEQQNQTPKELKKVVVFSVPLNLHGSSKEISKAHNILYAKRFLKRLKKKIREKAVLMPSKLLTDGLSKINSLIDFDDKYTAPLHGYKDAIDYYTKCSSINFLKDIKIPTLIVNALNDSFLSKECYPHTQLEQHLYIYFETPNRGGHCGFPGKDQSGYFWSERRALDFILEEIEEPVVA